MNTLYPTLLGLLFAGALHAQEICNNALDDDGDGLIDLLDPDCACFNTLNSEVPSLIPNPSFEIRQCCPQGFVAPPFTPPWLDCAIGWGQVTSGTTDYFHHCSYMPPSVAPLQLAPDGEGFVGGFISPPTDDYMEYIGRTLPDPLVPGHYVLEVWIAPTSATGGQHLATIGNYYNGQVRIALWGTDQAPNFPLQTSGCLGSYPNWQVLAEKDLAPSTSWQLHRFEFTSTTEVRSIILGGSCDQPLALMGWLASEPQSGPFILYDNLVLNTADQFQDGIVRAGAWCTDDLQLTAHLVPGTTEGQWYHNGIALVGRTDDLLDLSAEHADGGLFSFLQEGPHGCVRQDFGVPLRPAFHILSADSGMVPLAVTFTTANAEHGVWDLGDGTVLEGDTVVHIYTEPGTYTVTLEQEVLGCATSTAVPEAVEALLNTSVGTLGPATVGVFPNPMQDGFMVNASFAVQHWRVHNALGQVVLQGQGNGRSLITIAAPDLRSGVYTLWVEGAEAVAPARFIKR